MSHFKQRFLRISRTNLINTAVKYNTIYIYIDTLSTEVSRCDFADCTFFRGKRGTKSHAEMRNSYWMRSAVKPNEATPCGGRGLSRITRVPLSLPLPLLPLACVESRARATRVNWLENLLSDTRTRLPPRDTCPRAIHIFVCQLRASALSLFYNAFFVSSFFLLFLLFFTSCLFAFYSVFYFNEPES